VDSNHANKLNDLVEYLKIQKKHVIRLTDDINERLNDVEIKFLEFRFLIDNQEEEDDSE